MGLKPNQRGAIFAWLFHDDLELLTRAYQSSRVTAEKDKAVVEQRAAEFQKDVDAGKASWGEYDEDGNLLYDHGEDFGEVIEEKDGVLSIIRLAFVISLHHYFEQQLSKRLPGKKYDQAKAFSFLRSYGWQPRETELNELRLAANCAKHSEGKSADELYSLRADMFDANKIKNGFDPGYESLALTDVHVEAFFNAVGQSVSSQRPSPRF